MAKVCIIGGESADQLLLHSILSESGHDAEIHENGASPRPSVAVLDLGDRPTSEVRDLTVQTRQQFPNIPLLIVLDDCAIFRAIDALRMGASHAIIRSTIKNDLGAFVDLVLDAHAGDQAKILFQDFPTLEELEKRYMKVVLEKTLGRKERAAKILGINRRTLYRKEREYGWVSDDGEETEL
jgi:DNA-binding NtrC family response regulator